MLVLDSSASKKMAFINLHSTQYGESSSMAIFQFALFAIKVCNIPKFNPQCLYLKIIDQALLLAIHFKCAQEKQEDYF